MGKIRLGILDLVPVLEEVCAEDALQQAVQLAVQAEQWGYHRYWAAEHHDLEGLACPAPEILLSHIGARTTKIRLGTGALLLPHYSPMKVAESFNLLSCLYPGRIDLGIGRAPGGPAHASMALSGNFLQRVAELPSSIQSLLELLNQNYRYEDQPVTARPIPKEAPEVWMLGTNLKSSRYAAEYGTGYVFGHFMSEQDGVEVLSTYRDQFKSFQSDTYESYPKAMAGVSLVCAKTDGQAESLLKSIQSPAARVMVGGPETIVRELTALQDLLNIDEFLVTCPVPDYSLRLESYRLLADRLL